MNSSTRQRDHQTRTLSRFVCLRAYSSGSVHLHLFIEKRRAGTCGQVQSVILFSAVFGLAGSNGQESKRERVMETMPYCFNFYFACEKEKFLFTHTNMMSSCIYHAMLFCLSTMLTPICHLFTHPPRVQRGPMLQVCKAFSEGIANRTPGGWPDLHDLPFKKQKPT